jgi:hypothetical protein
MVSSLFIIGEGAILDYGSCQNFNVSNESYHVSPSINEIIDMLNMKHKNK